MSRIRGGKGTLFMSNAITGEVQELNTMTCVHCNTVVILNKDRTRPRNWCRRCNAYTCDNIGCTTDCNPIQEGLELALDNPGKGPFLHRAPDKTILFDERLKRRPF